MITPADILHGKILIVDDKAANVLLLERMLRGAGYGTSGTITSTMRPDEVCELHLKNRYDLILLDLEMPGMDGFQVMENLKEIEADGYLPVLVITAQPGHKMRALKAGAKDFVSKPFDLGEVLIRVHNMLEVRLLHQETRRLYERVLAEREVAERLVLDVLPQAVADRLGSRAQPDPQGEPELVTAGFAGVTVLFSDIIEFTKFAEGVSAEVLAGVLEEISGRRSHAPDHVPASDILENAYLATVGLPDGLADQTVKAGHMALDLVKALDRFNRHSPYKLKVKIGLDTQATVDGAARERSLRYEI